MSILKHILLIGVIGLLSACGSDNNQTQNSTYYGPTGGGSTVGILCDSTGTGVNSAVSVNQNYQYTWACSSGSRTLSANGIPNHDVGAFPNANNGNVIKSQAVSAVITLSPRVNNPQGRVVSVIGYALNGIMFDVSATGSCSNSGVCSQTSTANPWTIEVINQNAFNFGTDFTNGDVNAAGAYHYQGMPSALLTQLSQDAKKMTLIAWAVDGFPIYARYGYTKAEDATSAVKTIQSSYRLKTNISKDRPLFALYDFGVFTQDYEYVFAYGDLDECNGRYGVTPEFPQGIYHYYVTDTFPYVPRCVKG
jgi:hypothetical protein